MPKLQNFGIQFESQHGVCHAGQAVIGAVCIELSDSTNVSGEWLQSVHLMCIHNVVTVYGITQWLVHFLCSALDLWLTGDGNYLV